MKDLKKFFSIGFFCWKADILNFHFPSSLVIFYVSKNSPLCSKVKSYQEKRVPKSIPFFITIKIQKNFYLWFFWCDFRNPRVENSLYTDFQHFLRTRGRCVPSKLVVSWKMRLEINHVKVRKNSCYNGASKLWMDRSRRRN